MGAHQVRQPIQNRALRFAMKGPIQLCAEFHLHPRCLGEGKGLAHKWPRRRVGRAPPATGNKAERLVEDGARRESGSRSFKSHCFDQSPSLSASDTNTGYKLRLHYIYLKSGYRYSELFYINHEHNHCQREVGNALTQPPVQRPTLRSIDLFLSGAAAPTHTICWGNQQQLGSHS